MLNLANRITVARILLVPVVVILLHFPSRTTCLLACLFFLLASLSDFLDGYLARKLNMVTTLGKFLDPLADKILVCSTLITLCWLRADNGGQAWVPAWIVIVIIFREFFVTGLRTLAADQGLVMAADRYGKIKTVLQICALAPLTLHYPWFGVNPTSAGEILLYMALVMTVFSGGNYLYNYCRIQVQDKK